MNLRRSLSFLLPIWAKEPIRFFREIREWSSLEFNLPAPNTVKRRVLLRNGAPNATWIETGTYHGETTLVLSENSLFVHTIEPSLKYFKIASEKLRKVENVLISFGTSEECLPLILEKVEGDVNFWLDGHYSGGETFQAAQDTPIMDELQMIAGSLRNFRKIVVLIDDLRCFGSKNPDFQGYPERAYLIKWAEDLGLSWHIEFDMFIAKNFHD